MAQKDLKSRIGSVKNIQKITRAMEMVAAARLRRAEQRIEHLRPYAGAIRRMTRQAAAAAENIPSLPILQEHEQVRRVGPDLRHRRPRPGGRVQLADPARRIARGGGAWRRGPRRRLLRVRQARRVFALVSRTDLAGSYTGFTDRPAYANAREIAEDVMAAYVDGELDQVEILYNGYISPLTQEVRRETLLPLQQATHPRGGAGGG